MNFKLNLMLIPFYRPSDGIQLSPFVRHHNSQFSISTAKSRLRRLFAGRPLRWVSPFLTIIKYISKRSRTNPAPFSALRGEISSTFAGRTYSRCTDPSLD